MADGKITIETSIDNAGALRDLNKLINQVNAKGKEEAGKTASSFSAIGKAAGMGVQTAVAAIGTLSEALIAAGGFAVKTGIDFESAFAGVKKTVDAPAEVIERLRESLIDMSRVMPQSASELAGIAEAAGQLGIETQSIEGFTKTMAQLGDATNMAATEAADSLARFANITVMSQSDFDRLGSVIVSLGNNMATAESEITAMGMRLAGAGNQVGMTEAQIMSFSAALSSVGIEAEAGGSAFSTIMSKMQLAAENGGESLRNFADVAGMSADEFKTAFQEDAAGAIISFVKGLSTCEEQGKSAIGVLDDMGITEIRQRDALLRAAGASDVFSRALQIGSEAWEENTALADEASQRYETLESKIAMLKNGVEALGIQFKDSIDGELRNAVQAGMDSIERLSAVFSEGGLDAAVTEAGDIIADLSVRIAENAPEMVQAASSLLKSFIDSLSSRRGEIITAGIDVAEAFAKGVADLLPSSMSGPAKEAIAELAKSMKSGGLKEAASDIANIFANTALVIVKVLKPAVKSIDVLADNFKSVAPIATGAYVAINGRDKINKAVTSIQNLSKGIEKMSSWYSRAKIVTAEYALQQEIAAYTGRARNIELTAGQAIVGVFTGKVQLATAAQTVWNTVTSANPIGLLVTAVAAAAAAIGVFALVSGDSSAAVEEETNALAENADQIRETQKARQESVDGVNQEFGHLQQLWDELQQNVDANGKVKDGYEERAAFITSALSEALGTEITMTDGVIDKYGELQESISETIEKKRQQALLDAYQDSYADAVKNQAEANKELASAYADLESAQRKAKSAEDELKEAHATSGYMYDQLNGKVESANAELKAAEEAYSNAKTAADEYNNTITNYEAASGAVISGSESASSALLLMSHNMKTAATATEEELKKQVEAYRTEYENMCAAVGEGGTQVEQEMIAETQQTYLLAAQQHMIGQGMTQEQVAAGLEQLRQQIGASGIPETAATETAEATDRMSEKLASGAPAVQSGASAVTESAKLTFQSAGIPEAGAAATDGTGEAMGASFESQKAPVSSGAASLAESAKGKFSAAGLETAFKGTAQTACTVLAGTLQGQALAAGKAAAMLPQTIQKTVVSADLPNEMLTIGKQCGQSLAEGLGSQSGLVSAASDTLASSARNGVGNLSEEGWDAGAQFSSGLASGISSGAAGVAAAAAAVAKQAAESARANLDINSPSRVMEDVGRWYDRGLEKGIRRNADGILEAVGGLTDVMVMNPRTAARSVQNAFDMNISRIAERYASSGNRVSNGLAPELDYNKLALLFADRMIERLGEISFKVGEREFARLIREVEHAF